jgi:hypothetical protein
LNDWSAKGWVLNPDKGMKVSLSIKDEFLILRLMKT